MLRYLELSILQSRPPKEPGPVDYHHFYGDTPSPSPFPMAMPERKTEDLDELASLQHGPVSIEPTPPSVAREEYNQVQNNLMSPLTAVREGIKGIRDFDMHDGELEMSKSQTFKQPSQTQGLSFALPPPRALSPLVEETIIEDTIVQDMLRTGEEFSYPTQRQSPRPLMRTQTQFDIEDTIIEETPLSHQGDPPVEEVAMDEDPVVLRRPKKARTFTWGWPERYAAYVERFPAAEQRNHFTLQQHHATANHFDLRLQCTTAHPVAPNKCPTCDTVHRFGRNDGGTLSFAIPKGLSPLSERGRRVLAVETEIHPLFYSFHEGGGIGATGVWDFGTYLVHDSNSGGDLDPSTSEDSDVGPSSLAQDISKWPGYIQEQRLGKAYRAVTSAADDGGVLTRSQRSNHSSKKTRGFIVELIGKRYHIKIAFTHEIGNVKYSKSKYNGAAQIRRNWILQLATKGGRIFKEDTSTDLKDKSLLTGRTMDQIKKDGVDLIEFDGTVPREDGLEFNDSEEGDDIEDFTTEGERSVRRPVRTTREDAELIRNLRMRPGGGTKPVLELPIPGPSRGRGRAKGKVRGLKK
ncbi:hypothetical protein BT69DRAFT_814200 [Atractiella rhizophila]|nr:hypothetical protein BT69DRAFT_814200 [Atractiella rhizophila]